jgi:uncharacterized protein YggE
MSRIGRALVAFALSAGILVVLGPSAWAQSGDDHGQDVRTITAVGTGVVEGRPDVLQLSLGVTTREGSAADALTKNANLADQVITVLKLAGVADKDIQTSGLSISPVYDDDGEHVIAYAVDNRVTAQIHQIDQAGKIVDAATKVAGDNIVVDSLFFSFDDNSAMVAAARADAVKRAKAQAEQLATAAGVELGDLMSIDETGTPSGPPIPLPESDAAAERASTPINPGTQTTTVDVALVYEIS